MSSSSDLHKRQHVGLFFSNLEGGGIQRVRLTLARGLLEQGWMVDLVVIDGNGPLHNNIPEGVRLFDLQSGHSSRSLLKFAAYLKSENPAVVLSSQTNVNLVAIFARVFSGWRGRLLVSEHFSFGFKGINLAKWKSRLYPFLAGLFYRLADQIIIVSEDAARHFIRATHIPAALVKVIYNPIVLEDIIRQSRILPDDPWLDRPGFPLILAAGRLVPLKDFPTLLRAFALLHLQIPEARLLILGEGPEKTHLEQLIGELGLQACVRLPGFIINPYAYMANASVFVLSSRQEGLVNVLIEALACGTSIVSTDCPSSPAEILEDGKFGRLVPVGDPSALADAILQELRDPHDRAALQQRAADFSIDRILPQYLQVFEPVPGELR